METLQPTLWTDSPIAAYFIRYAIKSEATGPDNALLLSLIDQV